MAYDRAYVLRWIRDNPWEFGDENNPMDRLMFSIGDSAETPTQQYKGWPHFYNVPGVGKVQYDPSNGRIFVTDDPFGRASVDQETVVELQGSNLTPVTIQTEQGGWLDQIGPPIIAIGGAIIMGFAGGAALAEWGAAAEAGGGADFLLGEAALEGGGAAGWTAADYAAADAAGGLVSEYGSISAYQAAMAAAGGVLPAAAGGASTLGTVVNAVKTAAGVASAVGTIAGVLNRPSTSPGVAPGTPTDWAGNPIYTSAPGVIAGTGASDSMMLMAGAALLGVLILSKGKKR